MTIKDRDTAEHFYRWLSAHVAEDDQHAVEQAIYDLLRIHPDLIHTHSWPEMRRMADDMLL